MPELPMRDPKTGRFLSKYDSLAKRTSLRAAQLGQSPFEQVLTQLETQINDDSPAVQSYLQQLVVLARDHSGSAVVLRRALPIIRETMRLAAKEDPSLTPAEKRRIEAAGQQLITFIDERTNLLTRAKDSIRNTLASRADRIRSGVTDTLENNQSVLVRSFARALQRREREEPNHSPERAFLQAQADVYSNVAQRRKIDSPSPSISTHAESVVPPFETDEPQRERKGKETSGSSPRVLGQILKTDKNILDELKSISLMLRRSDERAIEANEQTQRDSDNTDPSRETPQRVRANTSRNVNQHTSLLGGLVENLLGFGRRMISGLTGGLSKFLRPGLGGLISTIRSAVLPALTTVARILGPIAASMATLYAAFKSTRFLDKMTGGAISDAAGKGFSAVGGAWSGFMANGVNGIVGGAEDAMHNFDESRKVAEKDPDWHDKEDAAMWNATKVKTGLGADGVGQSLTTPAAPTPEPVRAKPVASSANTVSAVSSKTVEPTRIKAGTQIDQIRDAMTRQGFDDPEVQANILGQVGRETGGSFVGKDENLNYSYDRFKTVFGRRAEFQGLSDAQLKDRFTKAKQSGPEAIAELVYGAKTKKGHQLGNTQPGDGYLFRGRGPLQITGRKMYHDLSIELKKQGIEADLERHPELINRPDVAAASVPAYFTLNGKKQSDLRDMKAVTKAVTGNVAGVFGQEQLESAQNYATQFLPVPSQNRDVKPVLQAQRQLQDTQKAPTIVVAPTNVIGSNGRQGSGGGQTYVPVPIMPDNPDASLAALTRVNNI